MPSKRIEAFVIQHKLGAIQAARGRLLAAYQALEDQSRDLPPVEALRVLATGLAALRHGSDPIHPEVINLEVVLADPGADHARWLARLREILRRGRARAEIVPLYGGALGEWLAPRRRRHLPDPAELAALRDPWFRTGASAGLWAAIAPRLDPDRCARARAEVARRSAAALDRADAGLDDPPAELLTAAGRADARSLPRDPTDPARRELDAAFRLAWSEVTAWDWPDRGAVLEPFWSGQRFRLRPRTDFLSAMLIEAVGATLGWVVRPWSGRAHLLRALRLCRLEALSAPAILVDNERRMLQELPDPLGTGAVDLDPSTGVRWHRAAQRARDTEADYAYGAGHQGSAMAQLWAEVRLARATGRPLHVFKTDIADFFPSVSHAVVDELLAGIGVDPELRALVLRVIAVRQADGTRTTCGLPLGLTVSRTLAALLIEVLLCEAMAAGSVEAIALVDDIVLYGEDPDAVERARAALERALSVAGLALHPDKTGWLSIGAPAAPRPPLQWGLLALGEEGWTLAAGPLQTWLAASRAHICAQEALLDRVSAWRGQLRHLWSLLAPATELGPHHLDTVRAGIDALSALALPGDDGTEHPGVVAMLRYELRRRFLGGAEAEIPAGWLHWPISAGGLGLPYPLADLVPLVRAAPEASEPPEVAWTPDDPAWGAWYAAQLEPREPVPPDASPAFDAFVAQFQHRGARLGLAAGELSPYWRWVLATFGADVTEAFGSFDFVPPDLVPLALIGESLGERRRRTGDDADVPF